MNQPINTSMAPVTTFQWTVRILTIVATIFCSTLCGCGTAKISRQMSLSAQPIAKPKIIYVSDFELDTADVKAEKGLLPSPSKLPGLGDQLPSLPGSPKDPKKLARELIDEMSQALVKELAQAGLNARRLAPGDTLPAAGWLVRGVFTEVNQGNQLRRAVIGFGMGKTDLQVVVDFNDLAQGVPRKFYEVKTVADSGKAPGAGPTIVLGPVGLAARFVIAGKDLHRNVKQTATRIASEVVQRAAQSAPVQQANL